MGAFFGSTVAQVSCYSGLDSVPSAVLAAEERRIVLHAYCAVSQYERTSMAATTLAASAALSLVVEVVTERKRAIRCSVRCILHVVWYTRGLLASFAFSFAAFGCRG